MAENKDPSVAHHKHRDYVPGAKNLGHGRLSKNPHEEFISQNEEREWVDTLLDCSQQEDKFHAVVNSVSWEEVATGWKPAAPNAVYISWVSESGSRKNSEKDKEKDVAKHNSQKLISFESDLSWKQCVEPGTYRYIHRSAYPGLQKKKTFNKGPVKRPMDANLKEHIRKVREHLEKVLVQQASPRVHQKPLGAIHNHGDYVKSLIRETNPKKKHLHVEVADSPRFSNLIEDQQAQLQTKVPDVGLTYTVKRGSPVQKSPQPHHPPSHTENKTPNDLVAALGSKLNELIQQDNFKTRIKTTKHSKHKTQEKLRSSYEKFTIPAQVDSPTLKPLVKVTPGQRKIHDDNEVIGAVAKIDWKTAFQSDEGQSSRRASPTLSKEHQAPHLQEIREIVPERRFARLDPVNKNFFTCGISGKAVSSTDVRVQVQSLAGMSSILGKNPVRVKKRGMLYPGKQGSRPVAGGGDNGFSVANRLGGPLHRGVVDRGVAGAIASELLPGVNGHKIHYPVQQAYRIV